MPGLRDSGGILSEKRIGRVLRGRDAGGVVRERGCLGGWMLEGCME